MATHAFKLRVQCRPMSKVFFREVLLLIRQIFLNSLLTRKYLECSALEISNKMMECIAEENAEEKRQDQAIESQRTLEEVGMTSLVAIFL